jgi:hypothetical protein
MSEEPKLVCATCGCERPKRFFKRKGEPALCGSCYYQIHKIKERAKEYARNYYQRPEAKERAKEYARNYYQRPEAKERAKEYAKSYRQRPEAKERAKEYARNYYQRPGVKERVKERVKKYGRSYNQRPEVKKLKNEREKDRVRQAASHYIKALISHESKGILKATDIPQNIIELKRHALILKRAITEKQDEQHSTTDI